SDGSGPLDRPLDTFAAAVLPGTAPDPGAPSDVPVAVPAGTVIGPYRVVETVGQGGMGSVVLAERWDGEFEHRVALKLVRDGRPEIVERFRHERQILAGLRHPNVATLLDGGLTEAGQPYFAMEYVDGERITDWCDRSRLDVDARLALFGDVCRAVQYAHRNLVIHRDLKPGNVLVTRDGTVKLLDFGIAKLLDADGDGDAATTAARFLTPAYAAPEQVLGEPTSTATDIYSLGVLLYELLTGRNPHGDTSASARIARAVVSDDPPSASAALVEERADLRGGDAATVRRRLRGDLDNILQKALRKSPEERYPSAEELRMDLERHRKRLPVSARADTLGYRISRFARRNPVGAGAIAAGLLAVLVGTAGVAWQADVAARERDRAREQAARAETVKEFLLDLFEAADPMTSAGGEVTAVEVAERGAERLASGFSDQPSLRAELSGTLGGVFLQLGEYGRADTLLARAVAEHRALGDEPQLVDALVNQSAARLWQRRLDEAEAAAREAIERAGTLSPPDGARLGAARLSLALLQLERGEFADAETILRDGIEGIRGSPDADPRRLSDHLSHLAFALKSQGDPPGAVAAMEEAVAIERELDPEGGLPLAIALSGYADALADVDRMEESNAAARESLEIMRREHGDKAHPRVGVVASKLARTVRELGRPEEAVPLGLEAIEVFRESLGDEHAIVAQAYNNLAVTYQALDDDQGALEAYREAVRIGRAAFGPRHPEMVTFLGNYGGRLLAFDRLDEAEDALAEAIAIADEAQSSPLRRTYPVMSLAGVRRKQRRLDEAERLVREAWEARREALGEGHSAELQARVELGSVVAEEGRVDEARELLDGTIELARNGLPATRGVLLEALEQREKIARETQEAAAGR
ncbi:MAG TPA: serine/threonine-protein kinase, partial [bacterium]|nr:serine/threonine-protein kinase [bacterium]